MASELWLREDLRNVVLALWVAYMAGNPRLEEVVVYSRALLGVAVAVGIRESEVQVLTQVARGRLELRG